MPRYFFHVHDGSAKRDGTGAVLSDVYAARSEALVIAGGVIRDAGLRADPGEEWRIEVTDDTGLTLFIMDFVVAEAPAVGLRRTAEDFHPRVTE